MDSSTLAELSKRYAELGRWVEVDAVWLSRWTVGVVLGVALELYILWIEFRADLGDFRRGTIRSPERPHIKKLIIELLSAVLVIVGVLGEFSVTRATGGKETEMRAISGEQLSIAEVEAAKFQKEADEARVEIIRLTPWAFDKVPARQISKDLSRFGKTAFSLSLDPKSVNFGESLQIALKEADWQQGWFPYGPFRAVPGGPPVGAMSAVGIVVEYPPGLAVSLQNTSTLPWTSKQAAEALVDELTSAGILPVKATPIAAGTGSAHLNVIVGHKP